MTDELELALLDERLVGFRLRRLEVRNWGTFDRHVWSLHLDGDNALLTGDIGSGKSTLVDALTTLLVPPARVSYNKAAGAEYRERSLASYVLGHYKSERSEAGTVARPVALRGPDQYTVLLAVFANASLGQCISLAQVFWFRDHSGQPSKLYVVAERDLSTAADFADFGADIASLRQRLRAAAGATAYDAFAPYAQDFRRRFGIEHPQALELFHQTVSMKSVGNLTEFVRTHMLEPPDVQPRIARLIDHYQDLTRAHDAVLTAKAQVAVLGPLVADLEAHDQVSAAIVHQRRLRDALRGHVVRLKLDLLRSRLQRKQEEYARLDARIREAEAHSMDAQDAVAQLQAAVAQTGGDRLAQLDRDVAAAEHRRDEKRTAANRFATLCATLGVPTPTSPEAFDQLVATLAVLDGSTQDGLTRIGNERSELAVAEDRTRTQLGEVTFELEGLARRTSNIEERVAEIRSRLSEELGIDPADLVFAGELLQVTDPEWQPAAERLMRGFGLSLIVPDRHYRPVARWVDDTNLRGRLVFFRLRGVPHAPGIDDPRSLVYKVEVRPGLTASEWVAAEVARRFDLVCARTAEEFQRAQRALTRKGQVKGAGERHEKDDRHPLGDRRRYVLGWSNEAKRATLEGERVELARHLDELRARLAHLEADQRALHQRSQAVAVLRTATSFADLDWQSESTTIAVLEAEAHALRATSDVLRELDRQLDAARANARQIADRLRGLVEQRGRVSRDLETVQDGITELEREAAERLAPDLGLLPTLDQLIRAHSGEHGPAVESSDRVERAIRDSMQADLDALEKRATRLAERIVRTMEQFASRWPLLAQDMDTSVQAGNEYRRQHTTLVEDDLPKFEEAFKRQLNENAIREVVGFRTALETSRQDIRRRIGTINSSLRDIAYQPTTYIQLESMPTGDADVREFQRSLRECTEDTVTGSFDDQYSEAKFLQVKGIVNRFQGRDGRTEEDKRWTAKVTDVRSWFTFAASERRLSDGGEHEHYSDSGGKSGGQKEKLAYTILAASLAYQFGLVSGETHSRTFRFVVIDEAFGRGSDESTRFGLELFRRMRLQLLVVTPLQKIHIIEPYVSHVGFVHNEGGDRSMIRNITIEEYRAGMADGARRRSAETVG